MTGAPEVTGPTAAEVALATPYGWVAVTTTRSLTPMSEELRAIAAELETRADELEQANPPTAT